MPIVAITTWPGTAEDARVLMEEVTCTVRRVTGAPLDKITVYIHEVPRDHWSEGGAIGSDPRFGELSRRQAEQQ